MQNLIRQSGCGSHKWKAIAGSGFGTFGLYSAENVLSEFCEAQ